MIESSEVITEAVAAVYALTTDMERGQVLTHEDIGGVLRLKPHEGSWGHVMRKVRRRLEEERGIATWPENTVGYKLCTTAEQLALPGERMKRGIRQIRRGKRSVEALPDRSLSVGQRRARAFIADHMRQTERSMRQDLRALGEQVKATPTLPLRPRPVAQAEAE